MNVSLGISIMAAPPRLALVRALVEKLVAQIDLYGCRALHPIVALDVGMLGARAAAARAWAVHSPLTTHHLVIQDDAVPCSDFIPGAICALEAKPDSLVSFFAARAYDFRSPVSTGGPAWLAPLNLYGTQAVALPTRHVASAAAHLSAAVGAHDDQILCSFAKSRGIPVLVTVPGLVDHADVPSLLEHTPLRSDRFIGDGSSYGMAWHTAPTHEVIA